MINQHKMRARRELGGINSHKSQSMLLGLKMALSSGFSQCSFSGEHPPPGHGQPLSRKKRSKIPQEEKAETVV